MNRFTNILFISLGLICSLSACQDDPELESVKTPSNIDFEIVQDYDIDAGGNTVILRSNTQDVIPMWDYVTGTSTNWVDTVQYAFAGDYTIHFSVLSAGREVVVDSTVVQVTADNYNYIENPLWGLLSGGAGNEKTWVLDIDATYFDGPLYFYGTNNGWEGECTVEDGDCWNWSPAYADNTWLMPYGDYGTMTFSLQGGPFVTVEHSMLDNRGTESGTYSLNTDNYTLTMSGATPLHDADRDACAESWGNIQLFSLTEDGLQLGIMRKASCEGAAYLVYNFVPQAY